MPTKTVPLLALAGFTFAVGACSDDEAGSGGADTTSATAATSGPSTPASSGPSTTDASSTVTDATASSASSGSGSASGGAGGGGGEPMLCNGEICHEDQTCEPSGCTFPCTGSMVPGDYATLQAAVTALNGIPGSVICLAAQDYAEPSFVIYGEDLTIVGPSASQTTISLTPSVTLRKNVKLRGVTFTTPVNVTGSFNLGADIEATAVQFEQGLDLHRGSGTSPIDLLLDRCDVAGGISTVDNTTGVYGGYTVTVNSSFIHDTPDDPCVRAYLSQSSADLTLDLRGNTIVGCERGIDVDVYSVSGSNDVALNLYNNIVANHSIFGISIVVSGDEMMDTANNALFGNAANYAGAAVDGPGYVKMDCLLDASTTPPGLSAGSPCLDAGDAAHAPATDYWGADRGAPPDIGAVEIP